MCNWNFPIKVMSCSGNWNKLSPSCFHLLPFSQSKVSRWQTSPNREMKRVELPKCWNSFQFIKWHWLPNDWSLVLIFTSFHLIWKSVKNIYHGNNLFCCSTYRCSVRTKSHKWKWYKNSWNVWIHNSNLFQQLSIFRFNFFLWKQMEMRSF